MSPLCSVCLLKWKPAAVVPWRSRFSVRSRCPEGWERVRQERPDSPVMTHRLHTHSVLTHTQSSHTHSVLTRTEHTHSVLTHTEHTHSTVCHSSVRESLRFKRRLSCFFTGRLSAHFSQSGRVSVELEAVRREPAAATGAVAPGG